MDGEETDSTDSFFPIPMLRTLCMILVVFTLPPPLILLPYKYASNLMKYLTAGASVTVLVIQAGWFVWFLNNNNRNSIPDCNCILSKPLYLFAYGFYSQDKIKLSALSFKNKVVSGKHYVGPFMPP